MHSITKFLGLMVLVFTLTLGTVNASKASLELFPNKASACPTYTASYELAVCNEGQVEDTFRFSSSDPEVITLSEDRLTIPAGTCYEDPYVWYRPKVTTEPGLYQYQVKAVSETTGEVTTEQATIEVLPCHNLDIDVPESSKSACRNEKATYEIYVANSGRNHEKVKLSTSYGQLNKKELTLGPGKSEAVQLEASLSQAGSKEIVVKAKSKSSYARSEKLLTLQAVKCYQSEVSVEPQAKEICAGKRGELTVTVSNEGTKTDEFELTSSRGILEENKLVVRAGQSKTTVLSFSPEQIKDYTVKVTASGKSEATATAQVAGINCKDVAVIMTPSSKEICENGKANYDVEVENTGQVADEYSLLSNLGSLAASQLRLAPGEKKTVDLEVDGKKLEMGAHQVRVRARSETMDQVEDHTDAEVEVKNCYDLNMNVLPRKVESDAGESTLYIAKLENTGSKENKYFLELEGPSWLDLKPSVKEIFPGQVRKAFVYAAAPYNVTGAFEARITARDESGTVFKSERFSIQVGQVAGEDEVPDQEPKQGLTWQQIKDKISLWLKKAEASMPENVPFYLVGSIVLGLILVLLVLLFEMR